LDKTENTDLVKKELSELFKKHGLDLEIITWFQQGHFYRQSVDLLGKIYAIVQFIVAIIFLISIANTINMTVFERMREFGTMMAIGNDRWIISATIIFEAMILGLLGAFFGILIGSGISEIVSFIGIPMPPPPQGTTEYTAYIALSPKLLGQTFLIATLSTWASAIHPAYRASHFPIIQALGYV
jgi:putative ABC transport system permease protein